MSANNSVVVYPNFSKLRFIRDRQPSRPDQADERHWEVDDLVHLILNSAFSGSRLSAI
jgi:hypothetical protein